MNILIVSNYYYPKIGAAPSRMTNMAEGLLGMLSFVIPAKDEQFHYGIMKSFVKRRA